MIRNKLFSGNIWDISLWHKTTCKLPTNFSKLD